MNVLVIDDEKGIRDSLSGVLSDEGCVVSTAKNGKEGLQKFFQEKPDLVFLDIWMGQVDGIEALQKMREKNTKTPVVIMSGHGTIETAVKATKLGAFDYLEKPLSLDKLLPIIEQVKALTSRQRSNEELSIANFSLIGDSEFMHSVRKQISLVAPRNTWVLITGENGTGKEVVARDIHNNSSRSNKAFIAVNCAAIPEDLIESELFGHVKGAFTNAIANKKGKFELAHQGTLFLDEIADMSLKTQAKVLRILQEQKFERVGDSQTIEVDVRVIAATNKNLKEEILAGNFREDLFYRLNVVPFHLLPLHDRDEDVLILSDYFLSHFSKEFSESKKLMSKEAEKILLEYPWPGNVRELKNLIERLYVMVQGPEISREDLIRQLPGSDIDDEEMDELSGGFGASTLKQARNDFEKAFILDKLEEFGWNVSKTAEAIGIERSNLHRKLRAFEIDPKKLKG